MGAVTNGLILILNGLILNGLILILVWIDIDTRVVRFATEDGHSTYADRLACGWYCRSNWCWKRGGGFYVSDEYN